MLHPFHEFTLKDRPIGFDDHAFPVVLVILPFPVILISMLINLSASPFPHVVHPISKVLFAFESSSGPTPVPLPILEVSNKMKVFRFVLVAFSLLAFPFSEASNVECAIVRPDDDAVVLEMDLVPILETFHADLVGLGFVELVIQKTSCFKDFLF